jgi:DNA-binding transcriptional LysR family regulator
LLFQATIRTGEPYENAKNESAKQTRTANDRTAVAHGRPRQAGITQPAASAASADLRRRRCALWFDPESGGYPQRGLVGVERQILDLEADLGSPLFERLPRGVRVTSAGEAFLVYARLVISELKAVESRIEQLRGLVRGQVSVAAAESVAGELLPSAITRFQATHPYVRFHVRIGAPEELVDALVADQVDLILTHDAPRKKDVFIVAVARQALCAMVVPDHPLARREELRLRDCLEFPLALADTSLAGRGLIEQVLANASFDLDPRLVSNSVEAMKAFAHMNRGVCFQFRSPGKALIPPGNMIALPLIDPPLLQARLLLATRRSRVLPVAAAAFVEQMKNVLG